jgi:signal transduction histidine kinase
MNSPVLTGLFFAFPSSFFLSFVFFLLWRKYPSALSTAIRYSTYFCTLIFVMDLKTAEQQKMFNAEKHISWARALVIVVGTVSFLLLKNDLLILPLAWFLLAAIWIYGAFIIIYKPYEKHPIFLASWFTYISDSIFATAWLYATGGILSPFYVIFYTSIIAVAFRFGLKITLLTATIYSACYFALILVMHQDDWSMAHMIARTGFIYIIGLMTYMIARENLAQTHQKITMQNLMEQTREAHLELARSKTELAELNAELKMNNTVLRHAEKNAMIGSYSWHFETNVVHYTDNLFVLLGFEPNEFIPSVDRYYQFVHPEDRNILLAGRESSQTFNGIRVTKYRHITKSGEVRNIRATSRIIGEGAGRMMIGTLQDVTADVILNEELQQKNKELEQINHQLASFNYIASHDLQEPVRKIHTFSDLILSKESTGLTPNAIKYLGRITSSTARMQSLIEAFLNFSRLGANELEFVSSDLNLLFDEVRDTLADQIRDKDAELNVQQLPSLEVEPSQLQQVFVNLVSNALKYSRDGVKPRIIVSAEKVTGRNSGETAIAADTEYLRIDVADNGIGFDPQYSERVFEVFQRLHSKDQYGGSGIGLAICRKIIHAHKGHISVDSVPGEGSVFHIWLPFSRKSNN